MPCRGCDINGWNARLEGPCDCARGKARRVRIAVAHRQDAAQEARAAAARRERSAPHDPYGDPFR